MAEIINRKKGGFRVLQYSWASDDFLAFANFKLATSSDHRSDYQATGVSEIGGALYLGTA